MIIRKSLKKYRTDTEYLRIYRKIIKRLKYSLIDWDLKDILRASRGGAKLGAFILASCFIDHLTCYYFGEESTRSRYIEFTRKFLPRYNPTDVYESIRCKLVHNYSLDGKYAFTHNNYRLHLTMQDGRVLLNLNTFINDIKKAARNYFEEIDKSDELKINMARRYLDVGVLSPWI